MQHLRQTAVAETEARALRRWRRAFCLGALLYPVLAWPKAQMLEASLSLSPEHWVLPGCFLLTVGLSYGSKSLCKSLASLWLMGCLALLGQSYLALRLSNFAAVNMMQVWLVTLLFTTTLPKTRDFLLYAAAAAVLLFLPYGETRDVGQLSFLIFGMTELALCYVLVRESNTNGITELAAANAVLQAVLDSVPHGIYVKDATKNFSYTVWNPGMARLTGLQSAVALGRKDSDIMPPAEAVRHGRLDQFVGKDGDALDVPDEEIRYLTKTFPAHTVRVPVVDDAGKLRMVIGVIEDITEEKHNRDLAQKQILEVQAQLVQASKLASLGTLGAGVAHELNNPLAAVRGYAQLLSDAAGTEPRAKQLAAKIVKASDRMRKIIDHLRIFSTDTSRSEKMPIDLNTVISDALILLQDQILRGSIAIELKLAASPLLLLGDANQIESIIQNLIVNAADALSEVTDGRASRICISSGGNGDLKDIWVTVEDNALGIPVAIQSRVFDPFFTTKEVGKGTGLGLSVSHSIAKDHGGTLTFHTLAGIGTLFTLRFPAAATLVLGDSVKEGDALSQAA